MATFYDFLNWEVVHWRNKIVRLVLFTQISCFCAVLGHVGHEGIDKTDIINSGFFLDALEVWITLNLIALLHSQEVGKKCLKINNTIVNKVHFTEDLN